MRVHELARALAMPAQQLVAVLRADGEWVASHLSSVPPPVAARYLESTPAAISEAAALQRLAPQPRLPQPPEVSPTPWERWPPIARPRRRPGPPRYSLQECDDYDFDYDIADRYCAPEITTRDVAERFDVTPATVRQWVARGHLRPVRRLGVTHVFRASDVFDAYERIMRKRKATGQDRRRGRFFMEPRRIDVIPAKHWDAVMTVDDAAELIGVSPATIRSWIHRGHLATTASSTRRAVRVRAGDVIRTAHERTIPRPGHRVRPSQKA